MTDKIIEMLKKKFQEGIIGIKAYNSNEIYVQIDGQRVLEANRFVYENIDCTLISLFSNDERPLNNGFVIYYAYKIKNIGTLLILKTELDESNLKIQSITPFIPAASNYEREIKDMFGIMFEGHPDDRELVFHENWPTIINPLRKDYNISKKPMFVDRKQDFVKIEGEGVFEIPVGPVHAGIIEPGHFRFSVAGEPIINLEAKLYYVHKGIEKLCEGQSFEKVMYIAERISGDETFSNSLAYCMAIEKIAGLDSVPKRALYLRTLLAELERIYNHLGDLAGICTDVAYGFAASQFNMMRRWCLVLNEELTGSRFLRSANKPGGVRKDFIKGKETTAKTTTENLKKEFQDTVSIIRSNSLFIDRVENTGVVSTKLAVDLGAVGPAARGAGLCSDTRKELAYAAYQKLEFDVPTLQYGDVGCRMNIKISEVEESIKIILQLIESMPASTAICEKIDDLEPYKYAFGITESPRGENCHFVMSGENNTIYRYKIRTPSFCNWPVLCHAVRGNIVADFPLINKSFNLSYAGNDL